MAKGTVTYVDGKNIGINTDGTKVGGDGPDKDDLKTDVKVNISKANILIDNVKGYASEIKNGDQIKASGPEHEIQTVRITRISVKEPDVKAKRVFGK